MMLGVAAQCQCCLGDVYFGTSWLASRFNAGTLLATGPAVDVVHWLKVSAGTFVVSASPSGTATTIPVENMRCDAAGNVYCVARGNYLYRFSPQREEVWRVAGGRGCEVDPDGSVWTANPDAGWATLLEYDADTGALIAEHAVDGIVEGDDEITQIAKAIDGTFRIAHYPGNEATFGTASTVSKYDATLAHVWDATGYVGQYNAAGFCRRDVALNSAGDVLIPTSGNGHRLILDDGTVGWSVGGLFNFGVCADAAGNWFRTTTWFPDGPSGDEVTAIEKLDSSGTRVWIVTVDADALHAAVAWSNGVVHVSGSYWDSVSDPTAWALDDSDGSVIWSTALGYSGTAVAARPGRWPLWS